MLKSRKQLAFFTPAIVALSICFGFFLQQLGDQRRLQEMEEAFEREVGPLDPSQHLPVAGQTSDNAAPTLLTAMRTLEQIGENAEVLARLGALKAWQADEVEQVRLQLGTLAPVFARLEEASGLTRCRFDYDYRSMQPTEPPWIAMWSLVGVLATKARFATQDEDWSGLARALHSWRHLSSCLAAQPELSAQILAVSSDLRYLAFVSHLLALPRLGEEELRALVILPDAAEREAGLASAIALMAEQGLAGLPGGRAYQPSGGRLDELLARFRGLDDKRALLDLYRRFGSSLRISDPEKAARHLDERMEGPSGEVVATILLPNLRSVVERHRAWGSSLQGTRQALALRLRALREGEYPERLDAASEAGPFDPYGGGAFLYERGSEGNALLVLPLAEERWRRKEPGSRLAVAFRWRLG